MLLAVLVVTDNEFQIVGAALVLQTTPRQSYNLLTVSYSNPTGNQ